MNLLTPPADMRDFTYRTAPPSVKLLVTAFLLLAVVGLGIATLQIYVKTGLTPGGTLLHYRGSDETLQYAKSFGEMVDITHAHAFTMPLVALTLGLVFVLTGAAEWLKRVVVLALFAGVGLELGLPWVVRYGPAWTVHLFDVAGLVLGGGLFVAAGVPLYEMWLSRRT